MISMSLNQIAAFNPCASGLRQLMRTVNKTKADDEQIPLEVIIHSNGIEDAIWCMRVNWFEHKSSYMRFVQKCAASAADAASASAAAAAAAAAAYASAADAASASAAAAAAAAYAAAAAAAAAAAYAAARRKERERQTAHLLQICAEVA